MQEVAISMDSASSEVRVPSLRDVLRKSIMARASRFLESKVDAWMGNGQWWEISCRRAGVSTMMALSSLKLQK